MKRKRRWRTREREKRTIRRRKRRKSIGEKRNERIMLGKKKEKNDEINFAMLVVAGSSSRERSKKEYLPCAISFPAHSLTFCTSIDTG